MAKAPVPGVTKTRLSPPLSREESAQLAGAFLRDTVLQALMTPGADVQVVLANGDQLNVVRKLLPSSVAIDAQPRPGLAQGMQYAIETAIAAGAQRVVVIGADTPTIPVRYLADAFETLENGTADVVLGPSEDGGYYLLGVTRPVPAMFEGIDWGSEKVYRQTLRQAKLAGLTVSELPVWYDIDDLAQLQRLADDLSLDGRLGAQTTRNVINDLKRTGPLSPETTLPWHLEQTRIVAQSPWRDFVIDTVRTHTGERIDYYYLDMPDAAFIVPVTREGDIVLVRQYRHPVRDWVLETPAGAIESGQDPIAVARRELLEEIGGTAAEIRQLGRYRPLAGTVTLWAHIFLALGVELGAMEHEESELIERVMIPHELAFDMVRRGEITEGQSAMAILHCEDQIREWLGNSSGGY